MAERVLILWNPGAGTAQKAQTLRDELSARADCIFRTVFARDQIGGYVRDAAEAGCDLVVAAGGDGTVNAVVNALAEAPDHISMAILPLGTGNDLARTLAIPEDPQAAVELLEAGRRTRIDRVRVETGERCIRYVNMGSAGISGEVLKRTTEEIKQWWGPLAYLRGAAATVGELRPYQVIVSLDDEPAMVEELYSIVLANGRTTARGMMVAPRANPEDGQLEVMLIRANGVADMAVLASEYFAGRHLESENLIYRRASHVKIQAESPMAFSLDGDLITDEPVTVTVEKQVLPMIVGPDYTPEPIEV